MGLGDKRFGRRLRSRGAARPGPRAKPMEGGAAGRAEGGAKATMGVGLLAPRVVNGGDGAYMGGDVIGDVIDDVIGDVIRPAPTMRPKPGLMPGLKAGLKPGLSLEP